jgi:uncharacterized protein
MSMDFPFAQQIFLNGLLETGCVGGKTGWEPIKLEGIPGGLLYEKNHSYGEYIFDWALADLYNRLNRPYYPKLLSMIPFTPATGNKSYQEDFEKKSWEYYQENKLSSFHLLFLTASECAEFLKEYPFIKRWTLQFHWKNYSYESFDHYLSFFKQRKRKNIRKERKTAQNFEIRILEKEQIKSEHLSRFYDFYSSTILKKYSYAYLTKEFFNYLGNKMKDSMVLVFAYDGDEIIAGSLNFKGDNTLYGRYWGIDPRYDNQGNCLHFELCYYQLIDFCIKNKIHKFEAGAGGGHKIDRGFLPEIVLILHHLKAPDVHQLYQHHCQEEGLLISKELKEWQIKFPFREEVLSTLFQIPEIS